MSILGLRVIGVSPEKSNRDGEEAGSSQKTSVATVAGDGGTVAGAESRLNMVGDER